MATYESLIKIKGSVGDLVFYSLNGKNVVRKKSGFNQKSFKKDPSYEKVRQNSSEFGHCSKAGKMIRSCIQNYIKEAGDPLLYQKFAKLMTSIKDLDIVSERGNRTVKKGLETPEGLQRFKEFRFGDKKGIHPEFTLSEEKESKVISWGHQFSGNEIAIVTIQPDFEAYSAVYLEEKLYASNEKEIRFQKHFEDSDLLLYFAVVRKKEKIIRMGFI
ncbi:hypothetical protein [Chryseobacterium kwangjuense]|uniref:Uncharacterized protein n=1 Tax=Chryseobacterium kwangjuense TaxID=267125 RepID=A0A135WH10_9FLAO|nr:hypothetical protein [Chryseobacterium kwangjuense]KXH84197.1 hypothetical protein AU378_00065 [Chryseobacterium kwangjuense]